MGKLINHECSKCSDVIDPEECNAAYLKGSYGGVMKKRCFYNKSKQDCEPEPVHWKRLFMDPTYIPGLYRGVSAPAPKK